MNDEVVTEITRRAMATEFGALLPGQDREAVEEAIAALEELEPLESAMSIYRPQSDVSRINAAAGREPVTVSQVVIDVLVQAVAIWRLTGGAFDVTAGPLVQCWGFTQRRGQKPTAEAIAEALALVGSDRIEIDTEKRTVMLRDPGMSINLGGIGKGFALDRMARTLVDAGMSSFLLHGGRSSVVARGGPGLEDGWQVAIEHPLRPGRRLGEVRLTDSALATSGSGKQFFHHRGQRLGHVIDPRTGKPAGDMLSLTVITSGAAEADALSTACFVEGIAAVQKRVEQSEGRGTAEAPPRWPRAAVAVLSGKRQGEVRLIELGATAALRFLAADGL